MPTRRETDNYELAYEVLRRVGTTVDEFVAHAIHIAKHFGIDPNTVPVASPPHEDFGDCDPCGVRNTR